MKNYEVVLVDYGSDIDYPPILKTTSKHEAFKMLGEVKKNENKEPYCCYDEVRVLEDGTWIAKFKLF